MVCTARIPGMHRAGLGFPHRAVAKGRVRIGVSRPIYAGSRPHPLRAAIHGVLYGDTVCGGAGRPCFRTSGEMQHVQLFQSWYHCEQAELKQACHRTYTVNSSA